MWSDKFTYKIYEPYATPTNIMVKTPAKSRNNCWMDKRAYIIFFAKPSCSTVGVYKCRCSGNCEPSLGDKHCGVNVVVALLLTQPKSKIIKKKTFFFTLNSWFPSLLTQIKNSNSLVRHWNFTTLVRYK